MRSDPELEHSFEEFAACIREVQTRYSRIEEEIRRWNQGQAARDDVLGQMAGNVAHGIRNPLGGIHNFLALLSEELPPEHGGKLRRIEEAVRRINAIVERLVLFSRPLRPHLVTCCLDDIVEGAVGLTRQRLPKTAVTFEIRKPRQALYGRLDPELMKQAFFNLFQNAAEAMPEGGPVEVTFAADQHIQVQIRDHGTGLPHPDPSKPFEPFYTTKTNGMGLGLTFSRMVIEKHGGRAWLEPHGTGGVSAFVQLPRTTP